MAGSDHCFHPPPPPFGLACPKRSVSFGSNDKTPPSVRSAPNAHPFDCDYRTLLDVRYHTGAMASPPTMMERLLQPRADSEIVSGVDAINIYKQVTKPSPATVSLAHTQARQSAQLAQHAEDDHAEPGTDDGDEQEEDEEYITFRDEKFPEEDVLHKLNNKLNKAIKQVKDADGDPEILKTLRVAKKMARSAHDMVTEKAENEYEQYQDEKAKRQRFTERAAGAAAAGAARGFTAPATGPIKQKPTRASCGTKAMLQLPGNLCACACGGAECNYSGTTSEICADMSTPANKCCKACRLRQSKAWDFRYLNKTGNGQPKAARSACWLNQNEDVRDNFAGRDISYVRRFFPNFAPESGSGEAEGEDEGEAYEDDS